MTASRYHRKVVAHRSNNVVRPRGSVAKYLDNQERPAICKRLDKSVIKRPATLIKCQQKPVLKRPASDDAWGAIEEMSDIDRVCYEKMMKTFYKLVRKPIPSDVDGGDVHGGDPPKWALAIRSDVDGGDDVD